MRILAIETSCDETSAAIIERGENGRMHCVTNVIATSLALHSQTGGIIPEVAAREQAKFMVPVIKEALQDTPIDSIDAIGVTYGPGLIGSLLVGVEAAKTLAWVWNKPIIPVNHLYGHIYANWLSEIAPQESDFPALALIVSGGHTDLVFMENETSLRWIGGTRDDAAGEAFDKSGRLLGLSYPAGPTIEKYAKSGHKGVFTFPRARLDTPYDFSFSGLKTAVRNEVQKLQSQGDLTEPMTYDLCYALQEAIFDMLIQTTFMAAEDLNVKTILLGGGVTANQTLTERFRAVATEHNLAFFSPERKFSTDNAAMIGAAAIMHNTPLPWEELRANPELYFD